MTQSTTPASDANRDGDAVLASLAGTRGDVCRDTHRLHRQHRRQHGPTRHLHRTRRVDLDAPVDHRRLRARPRRACCSWAAAWATASGAGCGWSSASSSSAGASVVAALATQLGAAHHRPGSPGRRRGVRVASHAVDHHQYLPARRAHQGHRHLDRRRRAGHRPGPRAGRLPRGRLQLVGRVLAASPGHRASRSWACSRCPNRGLAQARASISRAPSSAPPVSRHSSSASSRATSWAGPHLRSWACSRWPSACWPPSRGRAAQRPPHAAAALLPPAGLQRRGAGHRLIVFSMLVVFFNLTQFFQIVQGKSALEAGLSIVPASLAMMFARPCRSWWPGASGLA